MLKNYLFRKLYWYEMEDVLMEKYKEEEERWRWEDKR